VTTLATVGYGDVKGKTAIEYSYNILVEFLGIAFFSYTMSSVQSMFLSDGDSHDIIATKIEQIEIWLVNLDNSRMRKVLPTNLYD
jgi:hypothetical protein